MCLRYWLGFWALVAPVAAFCFFPFDQEDLRFSKRTTIIVGAGFLVLLSFWETALLVGNEYRMAGNTETAIMTAHNITRCFTMVLCLIAYFFMVRAKPAKKILVFAMGFTGAAFFTALGALFSNLTPWAGGEIGVMLDGGSLYFYLIVDMLCLPLIFLFARRTMCPALKAMDTQTTRSLMAGIILLMTIYGFSVSSVLGSRSITEVSNLTMFFCLSFCIFFSFGLFFSIIRQGERTRQIEDEARQIAQQLEADAFSYRIIMESVENARAIRHDFRHHMRQIGEMLLRQDYERISDYVESYMAEGGGSQAFKFCDNYLVNNLIVYYSHICRERGIRFKSRIVLGDLPGISEVNLTALFSNILENAVNACTHLETDQPYIRLDCEVQGASLIIVMENSCDPALVSSLAEDLQKGMGLRSVQSVVKRHGGELRCRAQDGRYITEISLLAM